jgi:hypothetical protein
MVPFAPSQTMTPKTGTNSETQDVLGSQFLAFARTQEGCNSIDRVLGGRSHVLSAMRRGRRLEPATITAIADNVRHNWQLRDVAARFHVFLGLGYGHTGRDALMVVSEDIIRKAAQDGMMQETQAAVGLHGAIVNRIPFRFDPKRVLGARSLRDVMRKRVQICHRAAGKSLSWPELAEHVSTDDRVKRALARDHSHHARTDIYFHHGDVRVVWELLAEYDIIAQRVVGASFCSEVVDVGSVDLGYARDAKSRVYREGRLRKLQIAVSREAQRQLGRADKPGGPVRGWFSIDGKVLKRKLAAPDWPSHQLRSAARLLGTLARVTPFEDGVVLGPGASIDNGELFARTGKVVDANDGALLFESAGIITWGKLSRAAAAHWSELQKVANPSAAMC